MEVGVPLRLLWICPLLSMVMGSKWQRNHTNPYDYYDFIYDFSFKLYISI